jgi:hypothetical protein
MMGIRRFRHEEKANGDAATEIQEEHDAFAIASIGQNAPEKGKERIRYSMAII